MAAPMSIAWWNIYIDLMNTIYWCECLDRLIFFFTRDVYTNQVYTALFLLNVLYAIWSSRLFVFNLIRNRMRDIQSFENTRSSAWCSYSVYIHIGLCVCLQSLVCVCLLVRLFLLNWKLNIAFRLACKLRLSTFS